MLLLDFHQLKDHTVDYKELAELLQNRQELPGEVRQMFEHVKGSVSGVFVIGLLMIREKKTFIHNIVYLFTAHMQLRLDLVSLRWLCCLQIQTLTLEIRLCE